MHFNNSLLQVIKEQPIVGLVEGYPSFDKYKRRDVRCENNLIVHVCDCLTYWIIPLILFYFYSGNLQGAYCYWIPNVQGQKSQTPLCSSSWYWFGGWRVVLPCEEHSRRSLRLLWIWQDQHEIDQTFRISVCWCLANHDFYQELSLIPFELLEYEV